MSGIAHDMRRVSWLVTTECQAEIMADASGVGELSENMINIT